MERKALDVLIEWKARANRKPLIIRGARQVGKTELVRIFARREFDSLIEINFDEYPQKASLFSDDDIQNVFRFIEIDANQKIVPGKTLLFLDEIQSAPMVLARLRYFYEKMPALHVICAGSLLDFILSEPDYSVPVGRIEFLYLGPMTFEEFLRARGQEQLHEYLNSYTLATPLGFLREYFVVGGLPGVVKAYIESSLDPIVTSREQQNILQTYYVDFGKYKKKVNVSFLQDIFKKIPTQIGKTVKYTALNPLAKSLLVKESLDLLEKARLLYRVFHSDANGAPLGAEVNLSYFKLIFLDTGLLLYTNEPWAEPSLYYWNRPSKGSTAEVDYLIEYDGHILPIEVKAGATGRLKSLQMFVQERHAPLALRFNSDIPSLHHTHTAIAGKEAIPFELLSMPLYLVEQTCRLVAASSKG